MNTYIPDDYLSPDDLPTIRLLRRNPKVLRGLLEVIDYWHPLGVLPTMDNLLRALKTWEIFLEKEADHED